jgi:hypothetical protein
MACQWIQRQFKLSLIGKPHLQSMMFNGSWDLQTFIDFLSQIIQRLLRL